MTTVIASQEDLADFLAKYSGTTGVAKVQAFLTANGRELLDAEATVISVIFPEQLYNNVATAYQNYKTANDSRYSIFEDARFRYITDIVILKSYSRSKASVVSGGAGFDAPLQGAEGAASVGNLARTEISGGTAIGYNFSVLCWEGARLVRSETDTVEMGPPLKHCRPKTFPGGHKRFQSH